MATIPPEIALLENLIELSIGNNQLTFIPAELLRLKKLSILSLLPNPFMTTGISKRITQRSLKEISIRAILSTTTTTTKSLSKIIPDSLLDELLSISSVNYCEHCKLLFQQPDIEEIVWREVFGNPHIPVLYRFCSLLCSEKRTSV